MEAIEMTEAALLLNMDSGWQLLHQELVNSTTCKHVMKLQWTDYCYILHNNIAMLSYL